MVVEEVFSIFIVQPELLETWHIFQVLEPEFSNVKYAYVCWSVWKQFGWLSHAVLLKCIVAYACKYIKSGLLHDVLAYIFPTFLWNLTTCRNTDSALFYVAGNLEVWGIQLLPRSSWITKFRLVKPTLYCSLPWIVLLWTVYINRNNLHINCLEYQLNKE